MKTLSLISVCMYLYINVQAVYNSSPLIVGAVIRRKIIAIDSYTTLVYLTSYSRYISILELDVAVMVSSYSVANKLCVTT